MYIHVNVVHITAMALNALVNNKFPLQKSYDHNRFSSLKIVSEKTLFYCDITG